MREKKTQKERVLQILQTGRSLTQKEAEDEVGTTRLSAIIHVLRREEGWDIVDRLVRVGSRFGPVRVSRYQFSKPQMDSPLVATGKGKLPVRLRLAY